MVSTDVRTGDAVEVGPWLFSVVAASRPLEKKKKNLAPSWAEAGRGSGILVM